MEIVIKKSTNNNKKFDAVIDGKKKISFGQAGASDFTKHKDDNRKDRYIDRHRKNENEKHAGTTNMQFVSYDDVQRSVHHTNQIHKVYNTSTEA